MHCVEPMASLGIALTVVGVLGLLHAGFSASERMLNFMF